VSRLSLTPARLDRVLRVESHYLVPNFPTTVFTGASWNQFAIRNTPRY